jgi:chemotaxis protein CheC
MKEGEGLSELELDALKEIMNIGFGQAAVALSEGIDLRVMLSVPRITVLESEKIRPFIDAEMVFSPSSSYCMVEEGFHGKVSGKALLLLPQSETSVFAASLGLGGEKGAAGTRLAGLGEGTFLEIGNILVGACVGKVAELFDDQVLFRPPSYTPPPIDADGMEKRLGAEGDIALVFKTLFNFGKEDVCSFLFLVVSEYGIGWVRQAVAAYLEGLS